MSNDRYRFTGRNHYHDGEPLEDGQVVDLSETEAAQFGHKFDPVEESEDAESDAESEGAEGNRGADSSGVDETESSFAEDETTDENDSDETTSGYDRGELEAMSRRELQRMAADADTDEISGRSSNADIVDYFAEDGG